MTRQLDVKAEQAETDRRLALIKALDFGIVGALQAQGLELIGLSITYDEYSCSCVVKGRAEERRIVAFVYSDTMAGCLLSVFRMANAGALKWGADKYYPSED